MAITFPRSLPSDTTGIASLQISAVSTVGISRSPFTGEQQVYRHPGQLWTADVQLRVMNRAEAEAWISFLLSLNGMEGTFLMGDPVGRTPRGVATGTPLVNGASQTGQSLITDGWSNNITGILKAGDWFQLGSGASTRLYKVLQDANSGAGGGATFDIYPRLRSSPADNAALVITAPKGLWRLASNEMNWSIEVAQLYGISFSAIEAL